MLSKTVDVKVVIYETVVSVVGENKSSLTPFAVTALVPIHH